MENVRTLKLIVLSFTLKFSSPFQEESLHFQNKLDALEAEILRLRHELQELESVNTDAQHARNVARVGEWDKHSIK